MSRKSSQFCRNKLTSREHKTWKKLSYVAKRKNRSKNTRKRNTKESEKCSPRKSRKSRSQNRLWSRNKNREKIK